MRWWEVEISAPASLADDVAALAIDAGADGAEVQPLGQSARVVLSFEGARLESEVTSIARAALTGLGLTGDASARERADTDWSERWKDHFRPLRLGDRLWVVPSWHELAAPDDAVVIRLDPGMAFGTGQHATTALCAAWLERRLVDGPGASVLDVGCGSGILAIAARKLGAGRVVAIDNDPIAVEVARENAADNHVDIETSEVMLADVHGTFDVVVANILSDVLCELAPELTRHTRAGGALVLSGILEEQRAEVEASLRAAAGARLRALARRRRGIWLALDAEL